MHLKTGKSSRFISTIFIKNGCNKPFKYIEIKVKSLPDSAAQKYRQKNGCQCLLPDQIHNWKAYCAVFTRSKRAAHA